MNHLRPDALQEYLDRFKREVFPKLASCEMSITIYSGKFDAKLAIELGAAILLEKPIILVVADGVKIPGRLQAMADSIVIGNTYGRCRLSTAAKRNQQSATKNLPTKTQIVKKRPPTV